jgi:hypothetical protein
MLLVFRGNEYPTWSSTIKAWCLAQKGGLTISLEHKYPIAPSFKGAKECFKLRPKFRGSRYKDCVDHNKIHKDSNNIVIYFPFVELYPPTFSQCEFFNEVAYAPFSPYHFLPAGNQKEFSVT